MRIILTVLLAATTLVGVAQTKTVWLLNTVANGDWPCAYYFLNSNDDLSPAEKGKWYALTEDESDWMHGVGPFSVDDNMFFTSEWPSTLRPILIRRHFTLTAEEVELIKGSLTRVTCSYDENPKMYLNGTLIWSATGWNDNSYAEQTLVTSRKKLLVEGDNVLAVSQMQGAGGGHIDFGMYYQAKETGIDDMSVDVDDADDSIYTVGGQRVEQMSHPGVYIVGGKKVLK